MKKFENILFKKYELWTNKNYFPIILLENFSLEQKKKLRAKNKK